MSEETGPGRALLVLRLSVAAHRNQTDRRSYLPHALGYLIAVQLREADIEQYDLRPERAHPLQSLFAAIYGCRDVSFHAQQHRERIRCILIVVDNQHASRRIE